MSTYVKGVISPDNETYKKHAQALLDCANAGIKELPKETAEYFDTKWTDLDLLKEELLIDIPTQIFDGDMEEGFEVIVSEIPKDVYKIRFANSY